MSPLKKRIKEIFEEKTAQYEADVKSGKKKPIVPVEDYINEEGIRIRVYKSPSSNGQDTWFSSRQWEFDSPRRCHFIMKNTEKQRMQDWQNLSDPKPSWESFKRMMPMFNNDASVVKAMWLKNVEKNQPVNT